MKSWKTTSNPHTKGTGRILMITDTLNLSFRYKHNTRKPFAAELVSTIHSFAKSYGVTDVLALSDKGKSVFRKELHPGYKGNREDKLALRTPEEIEADEQFFEYYKDAWELCRATFPSFVYRGVEADDLAAVACRVLEPFYDEIWLLSSDGDWDTLLTEKVKRFSYKTRREYTIETMYEEHGCDTPEQFAQLKALQGDPGDGINGIDGIGTKRGYGLLREYGSALDIADAIPLPGKQKYIENVNKSKELIERNIQLVDLPTYCLEAVAAAGVLDEYIADIMKIGKGEQ